MGNQKESITLYPDWRVYLLQFIAGALLVPALGAGIWIIFHYRKRWKRMRYRITNTEVIIEQDGMADEILLSDIDSCETGSSWLLEKFNLGTIRIHHSNGITEMKALPDAEPVAMLIERAAVSERERLKMRIEVEQSKPEHPSGTLDKKNELVGLWQQGLLDEDDYHREMKKFGA